MLEEILNKQKIQSRRQTYPSLAIRQDRLDRILEMMFEYQEQIPVVLSEDFGHRSHMISRFSDVAAIFDAVHYIKKNLKKWMRDESRKAAPPFNLLGAKAYIQYQPLGVVGIISPWNFPFNLTYGPLAIVLAAGNRAMIKPSEFTPRSSALMKTMINKYFDEDEVQVFPGDASVGQEFSALAFDHLLFTGSSAVAKKVMQAASKNLVPVTLELGGKSPVIVSADANINTVADRASNETVNNMYPSIYDNDDYTSMVNEGHHKRMLKYLEDAQQKGAKVIEINPSNETEENRNHNKIMPAMVINPNDEMLVMQEEIFGPIMPIKTYTKIDQVIDYINQHDRPLGLYYFGHNRNEEDLIVKNTVSGGMALNDVIFQFVQDDIPFGGIGPSGMGHYHGIEGFKTFSHARGVYKQTRIEAMLKLMRPPYGKLFDQILSSRIKK